MRMDWEMPVIISLILSWLPVFTDCHGAPESYVHYEAVELVGQCVDMDTETPFCIVGMTTVDTEYLNATLPNLPEPVVGEVQWLDVRAVDAVGHRSDDGVCE